MSAAFAPACFCDQCMGIAPDADLMDELDGKAIARAAEWIDDCD